ncbi:hypothetical protein MtrunA17_Chr1g0149001 [Medicago truncatula]|uniref:Transmembrane protein n=1 Tax=Medicago truncatula TaxID=3880 RepID=A0A396JJH0_MEDTR|nr:hypothetical protein MtrunA17_Chr1g0149001 [Medicago truncatula]
MLHGKINSTLKTSMASINNLLWKPIQSLLNIQIVIRIIQIIISLTVFAKTFGNSFHVLSSEPVFLWIYNRL